MKKYNYKKLKNRIRLYYDSQENFAKELNITPISLNYKLNNRIRFSYEELETIIKKLEIKPEEIQDIFFTV